MLSSLWHTWKHSTLFQTLLIIYPSAFLCVLAQALLITDFNSSPLPASILLFLGFLLLNGSSFLSQRRQSIALHDLVPSALHLHLHLNSTPTDYYHHHSLPTISNPVTVKFLVLLSLPKLFLFCQVIFCMQYISYICSTKWYFLIIKCTYF